MSLFAGNDREQLRQSWRIAWERHLARAPLEPLQAQLAGLIEAHPEYHADLGLAGGLVAAGVAQGPATDHAYMHLSLHMALREQLGTDRPAGIRSVHDRLARRLGDPHEAEHAMIEVLARTLWDAQRAGRAPDESAYLESLRRLA